MSHPAADWDPSDYARHSTAQARWAAELIGDMALAGHERILDLGCGDGATTARLAERVPAGWVVGLDCSAPMVRHARAIQRRANLVFVRADASALPLADGFDWVFSNAVLHWVRNHRPVLAGIARSLRAGGRCLLQMGGRGNAAGLLAVVEDLSRRPAWSELAGMACPYAFWGPEEYAGWLREAGLETERLALRPKVMRLDLAGLAGWFRTTWTPYLQRLSSARRPAFIEAVLTAYEDRHPADDQGLLAVDMARLEVLARRPGRPRPAVE